MWKEPLLTVRVLPVETPFWRSPVSQICCEPWARGSGASTVQIRRAPPCTSIASNMVRPGNSRECLATFSAAAHRAPTHSGVRSHRAAGWQGRLRMLIACPAYPPPQARNHRQALDPQDRADPGRPGHGPDRPAGRQRPGPRQGARRPRRDGDGAVGRPPGRLSPGSPSPRLLAREALFR